jgi:hypothetical protein
MAAIIQEEKTYLIVHPLNDVAEVKRNPDELGPMPMSPSVRFSLFALRGYLFTMGLLVLYYVLNLAGLVGKHPHLAG